MEYICKCMQQSNKMALEGMKGKKIAAGTQKNLQVPDKKGENVQKKQRFVNKKYCLT